MIQLRSPRMLGPALGLRIPAGRRADTARRRARTPRQGGSARPAASPRAARDAPSSERNAAPDAPAHRPTTAPGPCTAGKGPPAAGLAPSDPCERGPPRSPNSAARRPQLLRRNCNSILRSHNSRIRPPIANLSGYATEERRRSRRQSPRDLIPPPQARDQAQRPVHARWASISTRAAWSAARTSEARMPAARLLPPSSCISSDTVTRKTGTLRDRNII